jgi:hypothetical protein
MFLLYSLFSTRAPDQAAEEALFKKSKIEAAQARYKQRQKQSNE